MSAYLIDGYNLLHALGYLNPHGGADRLERARLRLLHHLSDGFGEGAGALTVIFDAARAPPNVPAESVVRGIHVRFARGRAAADDLIEELIADEPRPAALVVVSNDHRLQSAARRRGARAWSSDDLLDHLDALKAQPPAPPAPPPEKAEGVHGAEADYWLRTFGDLEDDPEFRELFGDE